MSEQEPEQDSPKTEYVTVKEKLLEGVVPALVTPFSDDGNLLLPSFSSYIGYLLEIPKVSGMFVCGVSGEYQQLSVFERMQVAKEVTSLVSNEVPVVVHVGSNIVEIAMVLAKNAKMIEADGIATVFPKNLESRVEHFKKISGESDLPFYVYWREEDAPSIRPDQFLQEMRQVPNFAGIKFTDVNLPYFALLAGHAGGELNLLTGHDMYFLAGLAHGSDGGIGTNFNFIRGRFLDIYEAFWIRDVDACLSNQFVVNRMIMEARKYGVLDVTKAILNIMGIPVGPRRYKPALDPQIVKQLIEFGKEIEVWNRAGF